MHDARCRHGAYQLETVQISANAIEQPLAASKENRNNADQHLIDEAGGEKLLRDVRAAAQADGGLFEAIFDAWERRRKTCCGSRIRISGSTPITISGSIRSAWSAGSTDT